MMTAHKLSESNIFATGSEGPERLQQQHEEMQECFNTYATYPYIDDEVYCPPVYDTFLCWPPTLAGSQATQRCPPFRLSDTRHNAFRQCGDEGLWIGRKPNETSIIGWTNFTPCFPSEVQTLFVQVYDEEDYADVKFSIAEWTRRLEIIGSGTSLIALIMSLLIFSNYRTLRNHRTRIHKNLFYAMLLQVVIRLIVYLDQAFGRDSYADRFHKHSIESVPYLCEGIYALLEYAITAMFMWMFIEGLYLHNLVTNNCLRDRTSYKLYFILGWTLPFLATSVWAGLSYDHYRSETVKRCWYGYNFLNLYWLMQAPRMLVVVINLLFLLNIMRVLIVKLNKSNNTEVDKARKAARAALFLLPLLGITNIMGMFDVPLNSNVWTFGVWCFVTHFLRSFQGSFIALIYCFLNAEVRQVVSKDYDNRMAMWRQGRKSRGPLFRFMSSSGESRTKNNKLTWLPLGLLRWNRDTSTTNQPSDTDMGVDSSQERRQIADEVIHHSVQPADFPYYAWYPVDEIEVGRELDISETA